MLNKCAERVFDVKEKKIINRQFLDGIKEKNVFNMIQESRNSIEEYKAFEDIEIGNNEDKTYYRITISPWNEDYVLRVLQQFAIKKIWQLLKDTEKPIYMIIDDTICKKTKPSSRARNPIEKCQFHQSHLVTVNKTSYYVYRYDCKINGFKNVVILISYRENALYNQNAVRSFISTDTSLTIEEMLL